MIGPGNQLLYLAIVLHGIRTLREQRTAEATEAARQAAASGVAAIGPRGAIAGTLDTNLGSFGVPEGWDPLEPSSLQMWRERSGTPVVGAMVRDSPPPTSIIDVTPYFGWLEEDPRDFLRIATDFRESFLEAWAAKGLTISQGPGTAMVGGCPAIWFYHAGWSEGTTLHNAQVHALVRNQVVGIQLMCTEANFGALVDGFWTVAATALWR